MGHDIENEDIERSDYSDINELYSLYKKINLSLEECLLKNQKMIERKIDEFNDAK